MTREELKEIIKVLYKAYGDKFKIDQSGFDVWCDTMLDLRFDVAKKAASEYVKRSQYPPTIADIRNEYNVLWEEHQALVRHINESFESAAGMYPNIDEEQRDRGRKIFIEVVSGVEKKDRERIASRISQKVIGCIRLCEVGTDKTIEPFDKCMERVANEFRSGKECNRKSTGE